MLHISSARFGWSIPVIVFILTYLASPAVVVANVGAFGGRGSTLQPRDDTPIRMTSEDILLDLRGDDRTWHVKATYWFANPTKKAVKVQMGFPESRCEGELCAADGIFRDLKTWVRGKQVKHRAEKLPPEDEWSKSLGNIYLYDVTFQPREKVKVVHRYNYGWSAGEHGSEVLYITKTGALWSGSIGKARFTILHDRAPFAIRYPRGYKLAFFGDKAYGGECRTQVVLERSNWTPTDDLRVELIDTEMAASYLGYETIDCIGVMRVIGEDKIPEDVMQYISGDKLRYFSDEEVDYCASLIEALHGRPFKNKALHKRFYEVELDEEIREFRFHKETPIALLRPNPNYSPKCLSKAESVWVETFRGELARRAKAPKNDD